MSNMNAMQRKCEECGGEVQYPCGFKLLCDNCRSLKRWYFTPLITKQKGIDTGEEHSKGATVLVSFRISEEELKEIGRKEREESWKGMKWIEKFIWIDGKIIPINRFLRKMRIDGVLKRKKLNEIRRKNYELRRKNSNRN